MGETRRGRISHATYVRVVGQMLMRDWFTLEKCEVLAQLEIVDRLVTAYPDRYVSPGWAVRALLDKAIDDIIAVSLKSKEAQSRRIAEYLELRRAEKSVTAIAKMWGVSRECVSRTVSRKAILLVTDRILEISRRPPGNKGNSTNETLKKQA